MVPLESLLAASRDTGVYLSAVEVFTTGLLLRLVAVCRQQPDDRSSPHGLLTMMHGEDPLLIGVEFADGRAASSVAERSSAADMAAAMLWPQAGHASGLSGEAVYFLSPLPPTGPLRLVTAWPSRELAETVTELPNDEIHLAVGRVRHLWDPKPVTDEHIENRPSVPTGGWFAVHRPE